MACETNILDLPLSSSLPADDDVVIMTLADGSTVVRYWSVIKASAQAAGKRAVSVPNGVLYNLPADTILKQIVYKGTGTPTINIGLTNGGSEIVNAHLTSADLKIPVDRYFATATTIYISGLTGTQALTLYVE
jgi:hypothetical protein